MNKWSREKKEKDGRKIEMWHRYQNPCFKCPWLAASVEKTRSRCTLEHMPILSPGSGGRAARACDELCLLLPTQMSWQVGEGEKRGCVLPHHCWT